MSAAKPCVCRECRGEAPPHHSSAPLHSLPISAGGIIMEVNEMCTALPDGFADGPIEHSPLELMVCVHMYVCLFMYVYVVR